MSSSSSRGLPGKYDSRVESEVMEIKPDFVLPADEMHIFDPSQQSWVPHDPSKSNHKAGQARQLRIVSFNVWFDRYLLPERTAYFGKVLEDIQPDLVGLQEVTFPALKLILNFPWLQKNYVVSYPKSVLHGGYVTMILTRVATDGSCPLQLLGANRLEFENSAMDRDIALVALEFADKTSFVFATSHLESLNSSRYRKEQLEMAAEVFNHLNPEHVVYCGDFNFDGKRNFNPNDGKPLENDSMIQALPQYKDLWPTLHPDLDGFTFDTTANPMIASHTPERMRYDRILHYSRFGSGKQPTGSSKKPRVECQSIDMIGTSPISIQRPSGNTVPMVPSDHFGLLATFSL